MASPFLRSQMLLGAEALERLASCRVAVFGLGGVGGYTVEALARAGIGALELIDHDIFSVTNLNRQLHATRETIGLYKADVAAERVRAINPDCNAVARKVFFMPETREQFNFSGFDYVVDAVDTVRAKLALAEIAQEAGTPLISAMGAGNKLDPTAFRVADIYETSVCPLARVIRRECRKRGIQHLKVVYSVEPPLIPTEKAFREEEQEESPGSLQGNHSRRDTPGSVSFVPAVAGLILAGEVVKDLIGYSRK